MFHYSYFDKNLDKPHEVKVNGVHHNNITNPEEQKSHLMVNSILATPEKEHSEVKPSTSVVNPEANPNQKHEEAVDPYLLDLSFKDILLFAAVISSSDAIAALAFINEDRDPKLFAILFGEGVVNDAVCIVIYKIMREFIDSGEGKLI